MKQKDIATIIAVIVVSGLFSFIVSSVLFGGASSKDQVTDVSAVSATFTPPSTKYFNSQSIDPTQLIRISNNSNQAPFGNVQ